MIFKKVLITGGAGYVGSALIPRLLDGDFEVTVYDTYWYGNVFSPNKNLREIRGDIRDRKNLIAAGKDADAIIHLACISNDPSFELNPRLGKSINHDAFFNILECMKFNNIKRLIYASSSSVYGIKKEKEVTEETIPEPLTDYSLYKLECEKLLQKQGDDFEYVIVRPATVCGYAPRLRLDLTVNILTAHALQNKKIKIFGGKQLRPNINIKDMVAVYETLLNAPADKINKKIFNAGYENHAVEKIAKVIQDVVQKKKGIKIELEYEPTDDTRSYHINSDKIRDELGFVPMHSIQDAVESIILNYDQGRIINALENPLYHNILRMKQLKID